MKTTEKKDRRVSAGFCGFLSGETRLSNLHVFKQLQRLAGLAGFFGESVIIF